MVDCQTSNIASIGDITKRIFVFVEINSSSAYNNALCLSWLAALLQYLHTTCSISYVLYCPPDIYLYSGSIF
jgi:hypothetical protein